MFTDHCRRSRKRIGDLHEQRLQLRNGSLGDGDWRGGLLDVLAGASGGGDRGLRAEAGDTKGLPAFPEVADEPVLGQLPSEAPSVLRDHIHPAKAEHEIVFFFLLFLSFLPLNYAIVVLVYVLCLAECPEMQETAYETRKKYNICAKA